MVSDTRWNLKNQFPRFHLVSVHPVSVSTLGLDSSGFDLVSDYYRVSFRGEIFSSQELTSGTERWPTSPRFHLAKPRRNLGPS